jgi:tetratricopeptide (TPR) repeat protein
LVAEPHHDEDESVRHLVALGYVDPGDVAARQAALRSRLDTDLRRAAELFGHGRGQDAVALAGTVAEEDPAWTAPRQVLAEMHYRAGSWDEARIHLEWLEHHGVVTPKLASIVGTMALARRDLATALEELEYAAHVEPGLAGVQSLLGRTLLRLRRWDAAEIALERATEQNPADVHALDGLATVALHRGDAESAAHWALEALDHDMQLARAHYHLGIALVHSNRTEPAIQAFEACQRLDPSRAAPLYWLSRIADQLGDTARAATYRERGREVIRRRRNKTS